MKNIELKELRDKTGLTQSKFAAFYEIPLRTYEDWETGRRQIAAYLFKLLKRAVDEDFKNEIKT
jgi:putative transcriptional regulator